MSLYHNSKTMFQSAEYFASIAIDARNAGREALAKSFEVRSDLALKVASELERKEVSSNIQE